MQKTLVQFLLGLIVIACSIILGTYSVFYFGVVDKSLYLPVFPGVVAFVFSVTFLFHYILLKTIAHRVQKFPNRYIGLTGLKLLLYLLSVLVFMAFHREGAIPFSLYFFITYALFTLYEVRSILAFLKKT